MNDDTWITEREARARFDISRTTWWRWRKRHTIRSKQRHQGGPTLYHAGDLQDASAREYQRNPAMRADR